MTKDEAIIASCYTGIAFCEFSSVHERIEKLLDRPVWTHELANKEIWDLIKERVQPDFMKMISNITSPEGKSNET